LPPRLRDLPEPPPVVFVAGELPRIPAVAVVGTRKPSPEGVAFARRLASDLSKAGIAVLSGGARGIDTAAHLGALDAGGPTVVVSPSSADRPFPKENAALFDRIVEEGGAILSLHEKDVQPKRHLFFARNELMAALSHALVVVESRYRGGARNAAAAARRLGRPVLAVPYAPWTKTGSGCILELKAGARVASSARDVLAAIDAGRTPESLSFSFLEEEQTVSRPIGRSPGRPAEQTDLDSHRVVELLRVGPLWPDEICRQLGLPAHRVQALLLTLTLADVVVSEPSGRISLINNRIY
jgi:DNA processing protein